MTICAYCDTPLNEHCDYEEHRHVFDEDHGQVVSVVEVWVCPDPTCGMATSYHAGDRPPSRIYY